ncbi:MAG: hypothetical protein ABFC34_00900 [Methanobacterium sp.]
MNNKMEILGLIVMVVVVVGVSGCTTTGANNTTSKIPISTDNTPVVTIEQGYLSIGGLLRNDADTDYKKVKINIKGYGEDDTLLYEKNTTIALIKAHDDADYSIIVPYSGKNITYAEVTVLNATPA